MSRTNREIKEPHLLIGSKLLNCRICSTGTELEALEWLQKTNPAGTELNWQSYDYNENPEMAPVQCSEYSDRKHYRFCC